jgi:hypothetical protein
MEIILRELPFPNLNKMNIALLHDSIEDIEWMDYTILKKMF